MIDRRRRQVWLRENGSAAFAGMRPQTLLSSTLRSSRSGLKAPAATP